MLIDNSILKCNFVFINERLQKINISLIKKKKKILKSSITQILYDYYYYTDDTFIIFCIIGKFRKSTFALIQLITTRDFTDTPVRTVWDRGTSVRLRRNFCRENN